MYYKQKKFFFCFLFILYLFLLSCQGLEVTDSQRLSSLHTITKNSQQKELNKESAIKFIGFFFSIDNNKEIKKQNNGIYKIPYKFIFEFENIDPYDKNLFIEYTIFDANHELLLSGKENKFQKDKFNPYQYNVSLNYVDSFSYRKLFYEIKLNQNNIITKYSGSFENKKMPLLTNFSCDYIVSEMINDKIRVSLEFTVLLIDIQKVVWIKVIPPDLNSYWNLDWSQEKNSIKAIGIVNFSKHTNYIDNGTYILQVNFGEMGIIQKEVVIVDILGNKKGSNYGLFIVKEIDNDINNIYLKIDNLNQIDFLELHFFSLDNLNTEIGKIIIHNPKKIISKQYLKNLIKNENGKIIKLNPNTKYYYQIFAYSKKINELKYISVSEKYLFNINEFDFSY